MIKINKKFILLFTPLILMIAFYLFADYQIGRHTLKSGEKQEIHLKAGQGIEPYIELKFTDLDGDKLKLSGQSYWRELIKRKPTIARYYEMDSQTISYSPDETKDSDIETTKRQPAKIDGDGILIDDASEMIFELNGKEDVTIYVENPTEETISFKMDSTYR